MGGRADQCRDLKARVAHVSTALPPTLPQVHERALVSTAECQLQNASLCEEANWQSLLSNHV